MVNELQRIFHLQRVSRTGLSDKTSVSASWAFFILWGAGICQEVAHYLILLCVAWTWELGWMLSAGKKSYFLSSLWGQRKPVSWRKEYKGKRLKSWVKWKCKRTKFQPERMLGYLWIKWARVQCLQAIRTVLFTFEELSCFLHNPLPNTWYIFCSKPLARHCLKDW